MIPIIVAILATSLNKWLEIKMVTRCSSANFLKYCLMSTIPWGSSPLTGSSNIKIRSEEHTSELQSRGHLVCRLLLEKKKLGHDVTIRMTRPLESGGVRQLTEAYVDNRSSREGKTNGDKLGYVAQN